MSFWSTVEINANVVEALRTWNAGARYWRNRVTFATVSGQAFYDLSSTPGTSTDLGYSVTDQQLVASIEYSLLEPATYTAWTGTTQFTLPDVVNALQRRRNQFLVETGAVLTNYTQNVAPPFAGRVAISNSVIDVRRLAWQTTGNYYYPLWREDEWALDTLMQGWPQTSGTPTVYSVSVVPPFTIQLAAPPSDVGTLNLVVVSAGATLDPTTGVSMGIPDDYAWVVKWGALADLLGMSGPAADPLRAQYCEKRWQEGIEIAKEAPTVLDARLNNVPLQVSTLYELDTLSPTWQNAPRQPDTVAMAGMNMLVLSPPPDGVYSVTLDIVQNSPIPALTSTALVLSQDIQDIIIDYSQHIAAFKMGGEEFLATMPHYERMMRLAGIYRDRTRAQTSNHQSLMNRGQRQKKEIPMQLGSLR